MARYSKAVWKPLTVGKNRKKMYAYNRMNLHVAVSEASSLYGVFNKSGAADSHFYVRKDGTVEQYVDTAYRANADYEGNDATISVETQGGVRNANSEQWTPAQRESLAQLFAWVVRTHKVPMRLATSSKKNATSRGLSWHRLGINGNFPSLPSVLAGRTQRGGGMKYSTSRGKVCPGDAKIKQIQGIYNRARTINSASGGQVSLTTTQANEMHQTYMALLGSNDGRLSAMPERVNLPTYVARMRKEVQTTLAAVQALQREVAELKKELSK